MKKRLKGLISVFFFFLCIFAWKNVQEVRAAENVIRDFSRIFYIPAGVVLKGGSLQKLQEIYDGMSCIAYTEDGEELYLDAIWDYSGIDIQTVGAYKITGTVRLPEGYTSNVGLPEWTAWISVQNPGQPEIQVYSRMISAGIYYFPWITEQNPDKMAIWLQREGEDWVNVSEEGYVFADTDGMYLSCQSMIAENIYTLTVVYNEGKPEILNTAISQMEDWRFSVISLEQLAGQYQKILLSVPARRLTKRACSAAWYMRCGRGRVWQKYGPSWRRLFIFWGAPVKNMRILRPIRLLSCLLYGISVRLM